MIEVCVVNLGWQNAGLANGAPLRLPADFETAQAALRKIGAEDGKHDIVLTEYCSSIPGLAKCLSPYDNLDELNYLASILDGMDEDARTHFAAAVEHGEYSGEVEGLINLTYNLACYTLYPDVRNAEDLGYRRAEGKFFLPEDCRFYFDYAAYGTDTEINEGGEFSHAGYIFNNRNEFTRYYNGRDIPEQYRLFARPELEKPSIRDTLKTYQNMIDATPSPERASPAPALDER